MSISFEKYLANTCLEILFRDLDVTDPATLARTVKHFTIEEGEQRDKIVLNYFGKRGVQRIAEVIAKLLLQPPVLSKNSKILDVGAGSGLFTVEVARRVLSKYREAEFFALDLTPAMLRLLVKKDARITSFIGVAENIAGSIERARSYFVVPEKFDAIFSTLLLHHSIEPERVFSSIQRVLKSKGRAVIVDLLEHSFEEFKTQMDDFHLGFKLADIYGMAEKYFASVKVEKIPGICCESSGRSAEIFVALMSR